MSESIYITKTDFNQLVKKIGYLESYVKNSLAEKAKSRWMSQEEAMQELGCKSRKLQELRMSKQLRWCYAGKRRLVRIHRKSVEEFIAKNSSE